MLRKSPSGTRLARAQALTTYFLFLELRHKVEKPVANSASFRMSIRSMVSQRRSISAFSATRFSGYSCLPSDKILIHGSPCFLTMSTPPVVPSSSAVPKRGGASRSRF